MKYYPPYDATDPNASYSNGNAGLGVEGSIPDARAIEHPQREILAAITSAGLTPAEGTLTQLRDAVLALAATVHMKPRGTAIASAGTTNIGAGDSDFVEVSGTTTITSLGAGTARNHVWVKFQSILTLAHNGTSLILPTGANIVTAAGDTAEFIRISGSNWQCISYMRANGASLTQEDNLMPRGTAIASAATTDIGAANSDFIEVSGTTTITSLGASTTRDHVWVKFQGILALTHNSTSLILPTGANITTAVGDVAEFVRISGSNWQCLGYSRASGNPLLCDAALLKSNNLSDLANLATALTNLGFGTSGSYFKIPNPNNPALPFIVQWVTSGVVTNGTSGSVTWPNAFPNNWLFSIAAPHGGASNSSAGNLVVGATTLTGATLHNWGVISTGARVLAIGN